MTRKPSTSPHRSHPSPRRGVSVLCSLFSVLFALHAPALTLPLLDEGPVRAGFESAAETLSYEAPLEGTLWIETPAAAEARLPPDFRDRFRGFAVVEDFAEGRTETAGRARAAWRLRLTPAAEGPWRLRPFVLTVRDRRTGAMQDYATRLAAFPAPPVQYSPQAAQAILEQYPEQDIPEDQKVSVVGIMLEAFCDLTDFPALAEQESVQEVYAPWHQLEEASVSGDLLTNIFAGGTVDTEWSFLTGYSSHDDFLRPTDSYVWYFDRQGYQTRGGHPGFGWFYDREEVNQLLGFQEYWFTENHYGELVDPVDAQWNSDYILTQEIVKDLQAQLEEEGGPVFSFSVSYQNHGPYEDDHTSNESYLEPEDTGLPAESCYVFNNYLHGVNITISALTAMVEELEAMDEPVVLVLFGDHKPWGGNGNSAYTGAGASFDLSTLEGFYEYYSTPYLIWANTSAKETLGRDFQGDGGDFSPCFLMAELFEQCGWTGPSFLQYSQEIRDVTPLVHAQGLYLDRTGRLTDALPEEDGARLLEFQWVQYYREHQIVPTGAP